jgi:Gluconate 2-dehydrogenase subunit 3
MLGGAISIPTMAAILDGCKTSTDAASANFALSADYKTLLAELAEVIIPKTDTPGAKEAGVGPFIEMMLKDCYSSIQQSHFQKGLEEVEAVSKKIGGSFVSLAADKKVEVMKTMRDLAKKESESIEAKAKQVDTESGLTKAEQKKKDEVEVPVPFFNILRELTTFGYFTSEPGCTKALNHVPIPGRYEGCIKITPETKAYAL